MNSLKKYFRQLLYFFIRLFNRKRSFILKYKSNFVVKEETDKLLTKIALKNTKEGNEELVNIIEETTRHEIFQIVSGITKISNAKEKEAQLEMLEDKLKKINGEYFNLEIAQRRIAVLEYNQNIDLSKQVSLLKTAFSEIFYNTKPYSIKSTRNIEDSYQAFEKNIGEYSIVSRFKNRERDKLSRIEKQKKYIQVMLSDISKCINSSEFTQAKLNIQNFEQQIKESMFPKDYKQLNKLKKELAKKELLHNRKVEDDLLQLHVEELLQLEIERHKKEEADRELEFVGDTEKDKVLDTYQIEYLYHMTNISNLPNILTHGLLSHNAAHFNGLNISDISMRDVNDRRAEKKPIHGISLHDYVPTYFNPRNPMLYKRKQIQSDIIIIAIDRRIIYQEKNIFSDGNATSKPTRFFNKIERLSEIDLDFIKMDFWTNHKLGYEEGKRIKCAETLAYPKISIKNFIKIYCKSMETKYKVEQYISEAYNLRVELGSRYYFK